MKKSLYAFIICFSFTVAQSQPALLSSEMLPYGAVVIERGILKSSFSVIDTTIQGADAIWNFGSLTNNIYTPDLVINIVNTSTTPYTDSFPNSNYGYKEVTGTTTNYRYFNLTDTKMERVGAYTSTVIYYNDPQVEYVFPLTLGAENNDTWDNSTASGTYDFKCIGTGTLTIPGGSYNALMVRIHTYKVGDVYSYYSYYWYSSDNGAILLMYIVGDCCFVLPYAKYMSSLSLGIEGSELITDICYNNPVENNFTLTFHSGNNADYSYTVINSMGQKVFIGNSKVFARTEETLNIDFSSFPAGIYFFSLTSKGSNPINKTIKIVKQ